MTEAVAAHRAFMPAGTERFLEVRSLQDAHRRLAELLRPGMAVLDVGCGSGAITEDIARAVAPDGRAVGIDVSESLIARALARSPRQANLSFELTDVTSLKDRPREFDVVTSARMLQWLADPMSALSRMIGVVRPGGLVLVLDYNHLKTVWEPDPPASFNAFFKAFLQWRSQAGMDNEMAGHLEGMFQDLGLGDVGVTSQDELTRRDDPDFSVRIALWEQVIDTRGHQIVADGLLSETDRARAGSDFAAWANEEAESQTLSLAAVEGVFSL